MSDIVNAVGVAQGTFYHYFRSKEDVFLAIFAGGLEESLGGLRPVVEGAGDAVQKIDALSAMLLTGTLFWLDRQIFGWSDEEEAARMGALKYIVAQLLDAPEEAIEMPAAPGLEGHPDAVAHRIVQG